MLIDPERSLISSCCMLAVGIFSVAQEQGGQDAASPLPVSPGNPRSLTLTSGSSFCSFLPAGLGGSPSLISNPFNLCYMNFVIQEVVMMKRFIETYGRGLALGKSFKKGPAVMPGESVTTSITFLLPLFIREPKGSRFWDRTQRVYRSLDGPLHPYSRTPRRHHCDAVRPTEEGYHWALSSRNRWNGQSWCRIDPLCGDVRFCCSGTEATMYAIRVAVPLPEGKRSLRSAGMARSQS